MKMLKYRICGSPFMPSCTQCAISMLRSGKRVVIWYWTACSERSRVGELRVVVGELSSSYLLHLENKHCCSSNEKINGTISLSGSKWTCERSASCVLTIYVRGLSNAKRKLCNNIYIYILEIVRVKSLLCHDLLNVSVHRSYSTETCFLTFLD